MAQQVDIIKGKGDKRQYRGLILPNNLEVILISDPETDKSAACVAVKVGSMEDPLDAQGLAHFLEHMLFLGTEKYPQTNSYDEYLGQNSGQSNAYTSDDKTLYFCDVANNALDGTLDRFAQFFIKPLFTPEFTNREINAVDSEFQIYLSNDYWRNFQLYLSTSQENSYYNRFTIGNLESLQSPDLRDKLLEFHKKYYSSNCMKLTIYGVESLDELEQKATKHFSSVPNYDISPPKYTENPFPKNKLGKLIKIFPVNDKDQLEIQWFVGSQAENWRNNAIKYIIHLLAHEGNNSLLGYLIEQGLALELIGEEEDQLRVFNLIKVTIQLTKKGLSQWRDVVEIVFSYIKFLRDSKPQEYIFQEVKDQQNMVFNYQKKQEPAEEVIIIAENMFKYTMDEAIRGKYLLDHLDEQLLNNILKDMNHENCRIQLSSKSIENQTNLVEKWFGIKYSIEDFDSDLLERWNTAKITSPNLGYPPQNVYLPTNFELLQDLPDTNQPTRILEKSGIEVWYQPDNKFQLPRTHVNIKIHSPEIDIPDQRAQVLAELWVLLFKKHIRDIMYLAQMADIHTQITADLVSLTFQIHGFNHHLDTYLIDLFKKIHSFNIQDYSDLFVQVKEVDIQTRSDILKKSPFKRVADILQLCLKTRVGVDPGQAIQILQQITFEDIISFQKQWQRATYIQWYQSGNITAGEVGYVAGRCQQILLNHNELFQPLDKASIIELRIVKLPQETVVVLENYIQNSDDYQEKNSVCAQLFQIGEDTISNYAYEELLIKITSEANFYNLRTLQQLGYVVWTFSRGMRGICQYCMVVQSPQYCPEYVSEKINEQIQKRRQEIQDMTEEEFQQFIESAYVNISKKDISLETQHERFWLDIQGFQFNFDKKIQRANRVKEITKTDFLEFYDRVFGEKGNKFELQLICQDFVEDNNAKRKELTTKKKYYQNYKALQRNMALYPDYHRPIKN